MARELFAKQGMQQTSLQDIADRLGITKPALYYHFDSREALVRSIVVPLVEELQAFVVAREQGPRPEPVALLSDYFDLMFRSRDVLVMMVSDLSVLGGLDLGTQVLEWRRRLMALLIGPDPPLAMRARAIVAIGGMSDCTVELAGLPPEQVKPLVVEAACAALGLAVAPAPGPPRRPSRAKRSRPAT